MSITVFRDGNAQAIFVAQGVIGTWPFNCLQAVGSGDGNVSIRNLAKAYPLDEGPLADDNFFEIYNVGYAEYVDGQGAAYGANEVDTVNALNAIFQDTGGAAGTPPTINSALSINVNTGDPINYFLTSDKGVGYEWASLPAGTAIAEGNPRNLVGSIASPGTYNVTMTAVNYFGQDTETLTINAAASFSHTKSVAFANQEFCTASATPANPLYRASNGDGRAWSCAFWFRPASGQSNQTILYYGGDDQDNEGSIDIMYRGNAMQRRLRLRYGTNNNYIQLETPVSSFPLGTWKHVVITFDGGTTGAASGSLSDYYGRFDIFVDGASVTKKLQHSNFGYTGATATDLFLIGRGESSRFLRSSALVEELALWDSDETANVAAIYNGGAPFDLSTLGNPPEHWWRMGDGDTYPTLEDNGSSGTGFDFTMTNMVASDIVNDVP